MRIEPPEFDETAAIADLWVALARGQRAFGSHLASETNRERIEEAIGRHIADGNLLVARSDGAVVGFAMFAVEYRLYDVDTVRGIIHNLFVVPDRRGEGIGSKLLERAEETLRKKGAAAIGLEVLAANEAARRFYSAHDYRPHRIELEKRVETDNTP
ncbi:GNAT family N-acetyltransferase [Halalkalicoccus jeotgali]|uniref:GCN5-like N-acetyltransferase n=1 Tax=Halalkalicoccus jeotgali (strain DSM 18796 / CECT 7217 / JCM 14584 / KCTC 4019 / B3) TaxID=795797 RepID=D8J346_HALJB|nr:GNAT family N-acetyltransferase [Halalkalicoccus jeotgali]ADJ15153.1 GCN5-related N-acetyltransferase [Halalkalicoccus jeotgali B3]ELY35127.1 GCN5-like N-acetyltransferase [Halalkalicoccus jeotgali B3]